MIITNLLLQSGYEYADVDIPVASGLRILAFIDCMFVRSISDESAVYSAKYSAAPLHVIFASDYTLPTLHFSSWVPVSCQLHEHASKLSQKQFEVGQRPTHEPTYSPPAMH